MRIQIWREELSLLAVGEPKRGQCTKLRLDTWCYNSEHGKFLQTKRAQNWHCVASRNFDSHKSPKEAETNPIDCRAQICKRTSRALTTATATSVSKHRSCNKVEWKKALLSRLMTLQLQPSQKAVQKAILFWMKLKTFAAKQFVTNCIRRAKFASLACLFLREWKGDEAARTPSKVPSSTMSQSSICRPLLCLLIAQVLLCREFCSPVALQPQAS